MPAPRTAPAQAPQDDTADAWTWHARRPSAWWGEDLPTIHEGNLREGRWWTQARTEALVLWLGDGAVRALAVALTGTTRDRWTYAVGRSRARWVADLLADAPADLGRVSALMARPLPEDRLDRAKVAARMLDEIAATVPDVAPGHDRALAVLRHRDLVEAIGPLWGKRHHPGRMGILPQVRAPIDHDARMLAAQGAFG